MAIKIIKSINIYKRWTALFAANSLIKVLI